MKIPLSNPDLSSIDIQAVARILKTSHLSLGPKVFEFESKFSKYIGTRYAQSCNSGTSALHLLMKAYEIGEGDEVITTPYSFIASSNCILFEKAKPVFADIDPVTFNIDVSKIEAKITKKTKAIIAVHVFGLPADMKEIQRIAKKHGLIVIEDACEAIGATIGGKKAGNFSDAAVFAFYPNKQMTTAEGGMIVTNDKKVSDLCASMKNQGRGSHMTEFVRLGYNYRLSDIHCALGISQLSKIKSILAQRKKVAGCYSALLSDLDEVSVLPEVEGYERSWFVYVLKLADSWGEKDRDSVISELKRRGIGAAHYFPAIHLQPFYRKEFGFKKGDFPVTEAVADRTFAIPFFNKLSKGQAAIVVRELKNIFKNLKNGW